MTAYYAERQIPPMPSQRVAFGTSGHRGSVAATHASTRRTSSPPRRRSATTAQQPGISGPLFLGMDTHALSEPAFATALEVLAANGVEVHDRRDDGYTPTPVDLARDPHATTAGATRGLADGIVITPSHNPPEDGGFKYNPPHGGPADTARHRSAIEDARQRAAARAASRACAACPYASARRAPTTHRHDYIGAYVDDLGSVVDLDAVRGSGLRLGVDPLGGASVALLGADRRALRARHARS